ncbi:MAG TPA: fibronectin type III domain-containing protein [Verrucomicrobiae bacterium]|jgi:hypothetical protein
MMEKSNKNFRAGWLVLLTAALLCGRAANAVQSLAIAWNPSVSTNIVGYHVYYGTHGTNYETVIDAGTNTSYEVSGLQEGLTNTFVVTSYNSSGTDSAPSNVITYLVPGLVNVMNGGGKGKAATLKFPVAPGVTYKVQASPDLNGWTTVYQTTATNNAWMQFQDAQGANLRQRYYRLVWQKNN